MTAPQARDRRRFRLAANDNETIVRDEIDVEAHMLAANDNETVVEDELDVEAHRLAANDNETAVSDEAGEAQADSTSDTADPDATGA